MKRLLILLAMLAAAVLLLKQTAGADYDRHINYIDIMVRAAACGDVEAGRAAQLCRDERIDLTDSRDRKISFDELYLLARVIASEAGCDTLSDDFRFCVGEVVMNRVASPEFPDTLEEVVYQEGQYEGVDTDAFKYLLIPDTEDVMTALRLLRGERHMLPWVVFQANFKQGGGTYAKYFSEHYGWTYFCSSANAALY